MTDNRPRDGEPCPNCGSPSDPIPAEARQDDEPVTRGVARALWTQRLAHNPSVRERTAFLAGWDAAFAARPSADTETLRRVQEAADLLRADADASSDVIARVAYRDAANRIRAALDDQN